jgi:hypothetical protein
MVKAWILTITASLLKWGIPESVVQNLSSLAATAESALEAAKNESTRMPVATAYRGYAHKQRTRRGGVPGK